MDLTVRHEFTSGELGRAYAQGHTTQVRFLHRVLPPVLAVGGVAAILADFDSDGISLLIVAVLLLLAGPWLYRRLAARQLRHLGGPTTLRLTDDDHESRSGQRTTTTQWSEFDRITTTPDFWLLYTDKVLTAVVPRSAFTPGQQAELEAFLTTHQNTEPDPRPRTV